MLYAECHGWGNSELAHETKFHLGQNITSPFADQLMGLLKLLFKTNYVAESKADTVDFPS